MDIVGMKKAMEDHLKNTPPHILAKQMFGEYVEDLKTFNKELWYDIVDNQVSLDNEELAYSKKKWLKRYSSALTWHRGLVWNMELPFQELSNTDFPTEIMLITHNNNTIVLSVMVGQGTSVSTCSIETHTEWMEHFHYKDVIDWKKTISVDELADILDKEVKKLEKSFEPSQVE